MGRARVRHVRRTRMRVRRVRVEVGQVAQAGPRAKLGQLTRVPVARKASIAARRDVFRTTTSRPAVARAPLVRSRTMAAPRVMGSVVVPSVLRAPNSALVPASTLTNSATGLARTTPTNVKADALRTPTIAEVFASPTTASAPVAMHARSVPPTRTVLRRVRREPAAWGATTGFICVTKRA